MQNTTPETLKKLNLRIHSEMVRIERIVDAKLISDTGSTEVGVPPVSTPNSTLWTTSWNALIASINANIAIDRTVPYKKLMMSTANHSMHKLDQAMADPVKFEALMTFGGLDIELPKKTAANILYTDLDAFKVIVDGAWVQEQQKIDTFATSVTDAVTNKGIAAMLANPTVSASLAAQGYTDGFANITHSLPI